MLIFACIVIICMSAKSDIFQALVGIYSSLKGLRKGSQMIPSIKSQRIFTAWHVNVANSSLMWSKRSILGRHFIDIF